MAAARAGFVVMMFVMAAAPAGLTVMMFVGAAAGIPFMMTAATSVIVHRLLPSSTCAHARYQY